MSEPRAASSIFLQQQIPTDFSCLSNVLNCLPCNVDGITERLGRFLIFELKHGETLSVGQQRMLEAWAAKPGCTILIIDCQHTKPNEKNAREFRPFRFFVLDATGVLSSEFPTNAKDFAARYDVWCRVPEDGPLPFTSTAAEFEKRYLWLLPGGEQARALKNVQAIPRPEGDEHGS